MSLRPDLTVAAVVERDGQFLLVEERVGNRLVFNQPAGHVERNEGPVEAAVREALEETAWTFHPEALIGIYMWEQPAKVSPAANGKAPKTQAEQRTFLRFTFCGQVSNHDPNRVLDRGIERAVWMDRDQIVASARLRSPMVLKSIDDYLAGHRYPLSVVQQLLRETTMQVERRSNLQPESSGWRIADSG